MKPFFPLTTDQRAAYERIVAQCDAGLARFSATNRMRPVLEGNRARALAELAR